MPILLLTEVFPPRPGGSGRWLWELYRRLDRKVHVVTANAPDAADFDSAASLPISRIPLKFPTWGVLNAAGPAAYWRAFRDVDAAATRTGASTIHCGKALPEGLVGLLWSWRRRLPYVCYVHGEELRLAHTSRDLTWLTSLVLSSASTVVANSAHTQAILRDEWRIQDRVVVMHPGVDTTRFVPAAADATLRESLGWTDRRVVLTVGALQQRKGQDMMIRALPAIKAACPDVLYVIAGEGWERARLEALVDELGVREAVKFVGVPSDGQLVALYQQCDLFALPNRQVGWDIEGFGIVLLEAQACGKPVITGNSGGTRETLDPGSTGELIDCDAPEPLAAAVVGLLQDAEKRKTLGAAARSWTTARFDWAVLADHATRTLADPARNEGIN